MSDRVGRGSGIDQAVIQAMNKPIGDTLRAMAGEDASAFRIDQVTGKPVSDATMAFRSGLHRTFKADIPAEDRQENKDVLDYLLRQIAQDFDDETADKVGMSKSTTAGVKSIFQHMAKGSYVSSDVAATIHRTIAQIVRDEITEEGGLRRTAIQ